MVHGKSGGDPRAATGSVAHLATPEEGAGIPPCAGCGVCCHLTVEVTADDLDVPAELIAQYDGVRYMDQLGNGACVALDSVTRLCTIYERRPAVCRTFERASALCRAVLLRGAGKSRLS